MPPLRFVLRIFFVQCWVAMVLLLSIGNIAFCQSNAVSYDIIPSISDLAVYKGNANLILVNDTTGSYFFYYSAEKNAADNGVVFNAATKNHYWIRQYDKFSGVDIAWFQPHVKEPNDDADIMKRALKYPLVKITRRITLTGKIKINENNTIDIQRGGGFIINDTLPFIINGAFLAGDYQRVFWGSGKALFGTRAVKYVSPCWFGAKADCNNAQVGQGTDNTEAITNAISAAEMVSDVYLPPTPANMFYRITSTITIRKRLHFFAFRFHGGGTTVTHSSSDKATSIFADFSEGAAINIQGSRRVYINDLCLVGKNLMPKRLGTYGEPLTLTDKVNKPESFLSAGLSKSYAGITTDAEPNSKLWSADVVMDNLLIEQFYLGIGISQAGKVQGDRMRVQRSQINFCVYGISLANHQNRSCHFLDVDMNRVWCGITNCTFAEGTGSVFQVTGGQWCNMYKCFIMQTSYLGQCVVSGLYTEAIGCIGWFGNHHPNNGSLLFSGCHFQIRDEGMLLGYAFTPPFYSLWGAANIAFDGCVFLTGKKFLAMYNGSSNDSYTGAALSFNACSFLHMPAMHFKGNYIMNNCYMLPVSNNMNYNRDITFNLQKNARCNTGFNAVSIISGSENKLAEHGKMNHLGSIVRKIPRYFTVQNATKEIEITKMYKDTIVFTYSPNLQRTFFKHVVEGDRIGTFLQSNAETGYDNPTMMVKTIDTQSRQVKVVVYTNDYTFNNSIALYTNCFFTTRKVYAIANTGSNELTNVENIQMLRMGDCITFNEAMGAYKIRSIDTSTNSVILTSAITEAVNGRVELFNQQIVMPEVASATVPHPLRFVTQNDTLHASDETIIVKNTDTDIVVTLPNQPTKGHTYCIKKAGGSGKVKVLFPSGTIDGSSNVMITAPYQALTLQFDGTDYWILR